MEAVGADARWNGSSDQAMATMLVRGVHVKRVKKGSDLAGAPQMPI